MNRNKVFIFEFIASGGFNRDEMPSSLFCEGFGMLRSIIADFKDLSFQIITLLDYRISSFSRYLKADIINLVNADDDYLKKFKECVKKCEYCLIIAPEFSNILLDLTKIVKDNDKTILSVDLEGIKLGSSKMKTYDFFNKNELKTPLTYQIPMKYNSLDLDFILEKHNILKRPIVIKPEDGVGAESIYYFESENQIKNFFKEINESFELNRTYILQEYIEGKDLSVSLIGNSIILSVNSQNINIKDMKKNSEYFGGLTPVENYHEIINDIKTDIKKFNLSKFNGYFGIDFIRKSDNSIYFIEINPRLTTSYIGIRNIIDKNPVDLILNSKLNSLDDVDIKIINHSLFSRLELIYIGNQNINDLKEQLIPNLTKKIPEFVTPPITFDKSAHFKNIKFSCFIATKTKNLQSSRKRVIEIKKTLEKNNFKIISFK
ncbi:MAG: ATP-grasp domain-containing protein [Promethearchaeota archaeon]